MADASRFPRLAPPFAIVGAAAGWLSAGLVQHPLRYAPNGDFRILAALVAMSFGAGTGALLRRFCVGKRYAWEFDPPDPEARAPLDSWHVHVLTILVAAGAAGATVMVLWKEAHRAPVAALFGLLCALPFLPVCAAVLSAARRAQRGRLGSLVAGADHRAVWGILAITLLIASLEGLPDWTAPRSGWSGPEPVAVLWIALVVCIATVFAADFSAHRRAQQAILRPLVRHEADDGNIDAEAAPRLDLGLGNDLHAHLHRGAAAYRTRDRALALVQGDPARAVAALRRALQRGAIGLGVAGAVATAHIAANSDRASRYYHELRCEVGVVASCSDAVHGGFSDGDITPINAIVLFEQACDRGDGVSCMSIADLYRGGTAVNRDAGMVAFFEYRAAQRGLCPDGQRLLRARENVCVGPLDARH